MKGAYYNEWDEYAAQWLRNLVKAGHIPPGDVDTRSIKDVQADDLRGYTQVHFFAGIGGWPAALRLAGWPDDRPAWTGSCPCQPFSAAGKRKGAADERHLWPDFRRLIAECRPAVVFGEQVASKDGRLWLAGVRLDLEALGYAVGAADLCAAGIGAPHIRQRLWWAAERHCERAEGERSWVADASSERRNGQPVRLQSGQSGQAGAETAGSSGVGFLCPHCGIGGWGAAEYDGHVAECAYQNKWRRRLAHPDGGFAGHGHLQSGGEHGLVPQDGGAGERVADAERDPGGPGRTGQQPGGSVEAPPAGPHAEPGRRGDAGGLGDADDARPQGRGGNLCEERPGERAAGAPGPHDFWSRTVWIECADGKSRRVEPGIQPLAHGVPARVGKLRAAGNAIVPQVAAEFIGAWLESHESAHDAGF